MNISKIEKILSDVYGITDPFDRWLKFPQISVIYLEQDANIYINDNCIFYIDSENEMLNISQNYRYKQLNSGDLDSKKDAYKITSVFTTSNISGFISSVAPGPCRNIYKSKILKKK